MIPVRAVCFDLGGVLIQIHHSWDGALGASGVRPPREKETYGPLGGFEAFDKYQNGDVRLGEYVTGLAAYLGGVSSKDALKVHMAILRDEFAGASDLVRAISTRGARCGCLSNTNQAHWETFFDGRRYAFGPLLAFRIGSHIERVSKPQPAIYEAFERACGFSASDVAYFDDGEQNVAAAKVRGWRAHLIEPCDDPVAKVAAILGL